MSAPQLHFRTDTKSAHLVRRASAHSKRMARKLSPLLCELHAHTTWSDGELSPRELCDLYGRNGFDVVAITDHVLRDGSAHVVAENYEAYLAALDIEAERAASLYDLLVLPGVELTYDDPEPRLAAHALAIGLRTFVPLANGLDEALAHAREKGAALVAAHPYPLEEVARGTRRTAYWAESFLQRRPLVHRFELFNRHDLFPWVAAARVPTVAVGDFHRPEHLATWKTLVPCQKDPAAVVAYLRSRRPVYLAHLDTGLWTGDIAA